MLIDGVAARACVIPAHGIAGRSVTTLEGLANAAPTSERNRWHPVQQAFEELQAAQCGYCLNGMVMQAAALLAREPQSMQLRYLQTLTEIASERTTTIVFPVPTNVLDVLRGLTLGDASKPS